MTTTRAKFALVEPTADDRHVSMSNVLARAAHGLNLSEKRLIALGLASTDSVALEALERAVAGEAGWKVKITADEYARAFDVAPQTAYEQLKDASDRLFERRVRLPAHVAEDVDEDKLRWIQRARYGKRQGYVELTFTSGIAPHLLGLRKHFTTYKLRHAAAFDSVYAWRLFEVLKSWQSTGRYEPSIEEFWDVMEAPPSCRTDFKSLRVRVIEPAVGAITANAAMVVEWEPRRSGTRRVTGLAFRFRPDPQGRLDMGDEPQPARATAEDLGVVADRDSDRKALDFIRSRVSDQEIRDAIAKLPRRSARSVRNLLKQLQLPAAAAR